MEHSDTNGLVNALSASSRKEHELLTWTTDKLSKIDEFDVQPANHIRIELQQFINDLANDRDSSLTMSLVMCRQISSLYTWSMRSVADNDLYDSALHLASILCEEDLAQSKTKKKSKAKTHVYSQAKLLSVVSLTLLVESHPQQLTSILPLVLPEVLKNIKKALEKEKYMHAVYLTQLMFFVSAAYKTSGNIDPAITVKVTKIAKHVLDRVRTDDQSLPKPFVNSIIRTYTHLYKDWKFVESQTSGLPLEFLKTRFFLSGYGLHGLSTDELRQETSKFLGEILHNWCFQRKSISLNDAIGFFSDIFVTVQNRSVRAGIFEGLAHFLGLTMSDDCKVLEDGMYLEVVSKLAYSIFGDRSIKEQKLDNLSKYMKFFESLHLLFLRYMSESGRLLMLYSIFDCGKDDSKRLLEDKDGEVLFPTIVFLTLAGLLMDDLSSTFITNSRNVLVIKSKLLELSASNNFQIRVHATKCLQTYLTHAPHLISGVLQSSLDLLTNELFSASKFSFSKCHGYTFLLANLVRVCNAEYVPSELVMRVNIFATTILKDHPPSGGLTSYNKQLFSWILLCGFMNYSDVELLKIQSSQLFLFWKAILTHSYSYRDEDELYKNIELRNHALACLLSYLNQIDLDADVAKQVFFLLTKCSTFNNSIQLKNKTIDNVLLQNENRILQIYLKIHEFVKKEFNSAVLILIVKNFADPNLYYEGRLPISNHTSATKEGSLKRDVSDPEVLNLESLLRDESGFAYGLSSKIYDFNIDELKIKNVSELVPKNLKPWDGGRDYWFGPYESEVYTPISSVLSYDSLVLLYGPDGYTSREKYCPRVTTSIVNSSIEVFSLIFPFLNEKIQYSVLESMNSSLFSKKTVTMRSIAVASNCCVALLGGLEIVQRNDIKLQVPVANLMLKMLKDIPTLNDELMTRLKAECAGLIIASTSSINESELGSEGSYSAEISDVMVKNILDHDDPYSRAFNILGICRGFKHRRRKLNFWHTLDLVEKLIKDPHPIVHTWSVEGLSLLVEGVSVLDVPTASKIISLLEFLIVNENYGKNSTEAWGLNYSCKFDSQRIIAKIVSSITQILGPEVKMLSPTTLEEFRNLVYVMMTSCDSIECYYGTCVITNLAAFKMLDIVDPISFTPLAMLFMERALSISLDSRSGYELFPTNATHFRGAYNKLLIEAVFELMDQLVRLDLFDRTFQNIENKVWHYFSVFPDCKAAKAFLKEWFIHTSSFVLPWLDKLYNLFFITRQQLANLTTGGKEVGQVDRSTKAEDRGALSSSEIIDVEEKAFTSESGTVSKVDALSWQFRFFVLNLMGILFSEESSKMRGSTLKSRVPKIIKLCFTASAMKNTEMKRRGLELLGAVIDTFSASEESVVTSSLNDEEAHIVSALMPAFDEGSSPAILPIAISTCAQYLCLCYSASKKSSRAVEILVGSLAEVMEKPDIFSCGEVNVCTSNGKSRVEIAVLNSWALITLAAVEKQNFGLIELSQPFWNTLVPLWIIFLREFISARNIGRSSSSISVTVEAIATNQDIMTYESVWINLTEAVCCVHSENQDIFSSCLSKDDLESFVFVVYAQSLQHLTLNFEDEKIKLRTLDGICHIIQIDTKCEQLFNEENIDEAVEVFERVVLTGTTPQLFKLVDVIEGLALKFFESMSEENNFIESAGKIYLLLRVIMMIITSKIPFLKGDALEKSSCGLDSGEKRMLSKCFCSISKLLCKFPPEFRVDLCACMLYIVGQCFQSEDHESLAPVVLPLLEQIRSIVDPSQEEKALVEIFFKAEKSIILTKLNTDVSLSVLYLLRDVSGSFFTEADVGTIVEMLSSSLLKCTCPKTTLALFNGYLEESGDVMSFREIVRRYVARLFAFVQNREESTDVKSIHLAVDLLMSFTRNTCEKKTEIQFPLIRLIFTVLLSLYEGNFELRSFVVSKITELFRFFTDACKLVVTQHLDEDQKRVFSNVVSASSKADGEDVASNRNQIELRSFV
ncbi:LAFA_0G03246g1_1 [Lachancea sp. 'fantastica']|nr:LAFA_0G03246g1_1 [Lachancea sp. 'fantastica']